MSENGPRYVSSIINKFGDMPNVRKDAGIVREILSRQGNSILIDVISDYAGEKANAFGMSDDNRAYLRNSLVSELIGALDERL